LAKVSGRGRRVQIVGSALVLVVSLCCMANGRDASPDPVRSVSDQHNVGAVQVLKVSRGLAFDDVVGPGAEEVSADPTEEPAESKPLKAGEADSGKVIYLTFDDGPSATYTKRVLDLLDEYDAKATFFELGENAIAHPQLTSSVVERGHALGNHTWNHKDLRRLSRGRLNHQITRTSAVLDRISGQRITCLRPPYGAVNKRVRSAIRGKKLGMKLWDIDPRDWKRPGVAAITRRVVSHTHPGAVSLMHDGGGNRSQSVRALKRILRSLSKKGYRFKTLPGC
jgi:peptidoglycan/xylan/chitin deacetylase (PgdA/CDA1 family)